MHPQWINTVKDIALAHTHTHAFKVPNSSPGYLLSDFNIPPPTDGKFCLKWSAALSLRGDVGTCAFHLTLHCGTLRLPVGCVCGWRSQPRRERVCWQQTQDLSTGGMVHLCVCQWDGKKTLHLHDQKNPEGSILYTRHTEWRLSSLKRTHCFLDWMLFKAWHLDYFQIFPSF